METITAWAVPTSRSGLSGCSLTRFRHLTRPSSPRQYACTDSFRSPSVHGYYYGRTNYQHHLSGSVISMSSISTFSAKMLPFRQLLLGASSKTLRASLACSIGINSCKVCSSFPTHPFRQRQKLSKGSINTLFSQHPSVQSDRVEITGIDSFSLAAQFVSYLEVKIFTSVANVIVQTSNQN